MQFEDIFMIFSVLKFLKEGTYIKQVRWKIELPFHGIFTQ